MATTAPLSFTIRNAAASVAGNGNDIIAVTSGANYEVKLHMSDVDMETATDTLSLTAITPTSISVDLKQALAAGAQFTSTASASVLIPSVNCASVKYLCAVLTIPSTSSYKDAVAALSSNAKCQIITSKKTCSPGEIVIVLFITFAP